MDARIKGYLVTAGIVVATLVVLRFVATSNVPVVGSIAKMALGQTTTTAAG